MTWFISERWETFAALVLIVTAPLGMKVKTDKQLLLAARLCMQSYHLPKILAFYSHLMVDKNKTKSAQKNALMHLVQEITTMKPT